MELTEFSNNMEAAAKQVGDTSDLMQRIAYIAIGPIKRKTRVRTGALRNSLHDSVEPNRAIIATNIAYAQFVNKRFPYLLPGAEEAMPQIQRELQAFGKTLVSEIKS